MAGESAQNKARQMHERIERQRRVAEAYERGAEGEMATAVALEGLPDEWVVLHDLGWPGRRFANIDHVVIGPGGVFVIDSKNWSGRVWLDGRTIRQNGRSRHKAVAGSVQAAIAVGELIPLYIDYVYPVLCFHGHEIGGTAYDVLVCSTSNVAEMLTARPRVFEPQHVEFVRLALEASMTSATHEDRHKVATAVPTAPALPRAVNAPRPARATRRRGPRLHLGRALAGAALLTVAFVPTVRDGLTGLLADLVVPGPVSTCSVESEASPENCAKPPGKKKGVKSKERAGDK